MKKQEQHNYLLMRDDLKALGGQLKSWGQAWGLKVKIMPEGLHGEGLQVWKGHRFLRFTISSPKELGPDTERDLVWGVKIQEALSNAERSEEHTSELQSHSDLVCRLLLEKKKKNKE